MDHQQPVPEDQVLTYTYRRERATEANSLGCLLTGLHRRDLAESMFNAERVLKAWAEELREPPAVAS